MEFILVNPMNDSTLIANRNNLFPDEEQKGQHTTLVRILASRPSCPRFESMCSQKNSEKFFLMLLMSNNGAA